MTLDRRRLGSLLAAALATACTAEGSLSGAPPVELVVRTGASCASGCSLDRAVLVGSELVADVLASGELGDVEARALDPEIATAWIEPIELCCGEGPGATCTRVEHPELPCGGETSVAPRVVLRTLSVGETAIEILEGGSSLGARPVRVEDAAEVNAVPSIHVEGASPDVVAEDGAWVDGRLDAIRLREGQVMRAWLVAIASDGSRLLHDDGAIARLSDRTVAAVGPAIGVCSGIFAEGPRVEIEGVSQGTATLVIEAGSARQELPVVVAAACDSQGQLEPTEVPCTSDADCVPAACCHPETCVSPGDAPDCGGVACTLECRAGTLDCGGRCLCLEGRCAAYIPALPTPGCEVPPPGTPF